MTNTVHTFTMSEAHALTIHRMIRDHRMALHNWIASAVETSQWDRATKLVKELRDCNRLFAGFNLESKAESAKINGRVIEDRHVIPMN